jgi:hypothetical protein
MSVRHVLVVKDSKGKHIVEDTKISGGDVMERVLSVTNTLIECRVIRDKMEFVSLTITSID